MVGLNLSRLDVTGIRMDQTDKRNTANGDVRTDAGEWERLHTLHSGGCGFEGALLPV